MSCSPALLWTLFRAKWVSWKTELAAVFSSSSASLRSALLQLHNKGRSRWKFQGGTISCSLSQHLRPSKTFFLSFLHVSFLQWRLRGGTKKRPQMTRQRTFLKNFFYMRLCRAFPSTRAEYRVTGGKGWLFSNKKEWIEDSVEESVWSNWGHKLAGKSNLQWELHLATHASQ